MLSVFDGLRDVTTLSVFVRLACALICGGIIGIERSYKRRPAGFRTHILICIGATITTLTSQYLYLNMHYFTDMARLGAQVVAGIGFIGAGTIIVTKRQRVKGLTTAAGLWTSAIIGLTFGGGFYEGGILATVFIMLAELVFSRIEYRVLENVPERKKAAMQPPNTRRITALVFCFLKFGVVYSSSTDTIPSRLPTSVSSFSTPQLRGRRSVKIAQALCSPFSAERVIWMFRTLILQLR